MNEFICLFLPAILAFNKKDLNKSPLELIRKYASNALMTNFFAMLIVYIAQQISGYSEIEYTYKFTLEYLILAFAIVKIVPKISKCLKNSIKIEVRRENRRKNTKRN